MTVKKQYYLFKFSKPENTESLLNGEIYFSRSGHFVDLEKQQIDKGIGDEYEGVWSRNLKKSNRALIFENEGKLVHLPLKNALYNHVYHDVRRLPISCFVLLREEDFEINEETGEGILNPELHEKLIAQFVGRDIVYIANGGEFQRRLESALNQAELGWKRGLVRYYDEKKENHPLSEDEYEANPANGLFYKRDFFRFQKELRYVINELAEEDRPVNIGDIRDLAINFGRVETGKELFKATMQK